MLRFYPFHRNSFHPALVLDDLQFSALYTLQFFSIRVLFKFSPDRHTSNDNDEKWIFHFWTIIEIINKIQDKWILEIFLKEKLFLTHSSSLCSTTRTPTTNGTTTYPSSLTAAGAFNSLVRRMELKNKSLGSRLAIRSYTRTKLFLLFHIFWLWRYIFFVLPLNSQHFSCFFRRMSFSMLHAENCVVF